MRRPSCDNNSICLDGRHARARDTLQFRKRRRVVEELELRQAVSLGGSLARPACFDGKSRNFYNPNAERESHLFEAGVEPAAVLHAQPEHER